MNLSRQCSIRKSYLDIFVFSNLNLRNLKHFQLVRTIFTHDPLICYIVTMFPNCIFSVHSQFNYFINFLKLQQISALFQVFDSKICIMMWRFDAFNRNLGEEVLQYNNFWIFWVPNFGERNICAFWCWETENRQGKSLSFKEVQLTRIRSVYLIWGLTSQVFS